MPPEQQDVALLEIGVVETFSHGLVDLPADMMADPQVDRPAPANERHGDTFAHDPHVLNVINPSRQTAFHTESLTKSKDLGNRRQVVSDSLMDDRKLSEKPTLMSTSRNMAASKYDWLPALIALRKAG